jgi:hypothetical protein
MENILHKLTALDFTGEPMFSKELEPEIAGLSHPWPADQVERWPIERLKRYANNPRLHSEADLGKLAASILKWGWTMPVLVGEDGELISGHARVGAAIILVAEIHPGDCRQRLE